VQLRLGLADVRAAARQFRRHADADDGGHRGHRRRRRQQRVQRARRLADQQAELVDRLLLLLLVAGQPGLIVAELRERLIDIELRRQPLALLALRQIERALRGRHVLLLARQQRLRAAHLHIGVGHLALQHDQGVVGRLHLRLRGGFGLFDRAARLAEQVELPGGIEAVLVEVDGLFDRVQRAAGGRTDLGAEAGAVLVQRRIRVGQRAELVGDAAGFQDALGADLLAHVAAGAAERGQPGRARGDLALARRDDPQHGLLQVEVAGDRLILEPGQNGIVEAAPPFRVGVAGGADPRVRAGAARGGIVPAPNVGWFRRNEVGSDRASRKAEEQHGGRDGTRAPHRQCAPPAALGLMPDISKAVGISTKAAQPVMRKTSL
jgi:hypothetical protein